MKTRIIVISDTHYADKAGCPERRGEIGDILLLRAVHRINRYLKPDLVCLLGDLVDDADTDHLRELRGIIDLLEPPLIVVPGNHDGETDDFFKIFPPPPDHIDIGCCRFIPFVDSEEPGYNARRSVSEIKRMSALAADWSGPVATVQHVPLFHTGSYQSYNYTNADDITAAMSASGVTHTISGHFHRGFHLPDDNGLSVVVAPALCEKPFRFLEVLIDSNGETTVSELSLALDESLDLSDLHIHTSFAYCNENMDIAKTLELRDDFNLRSTCFAEHSAHLQMNRAEYAKFAKTGATDVSSKSRIHDYLLETGEIRSRRALVGFEVDCDFSGKPLLPLEAREKADVIIGAIHFLPPDATGSLESAKTAFSKMLDA
ncbi:MAG: metallophosphoesterase, partial [Victivallales bacterium]|nr:metallophosphoesterase [Victivallales bacterium]